MFLNGKVVDRNIPNWSPLEEKLSEQVAAYR